MVNTRELPFQGQNIRYLDTGRRTSSLVKLYSGRRTMGYFGWALSDVRLLFFSLLYSNLFTSYVLLFN